MTLDADEWRRVRDCFEAALRVAPAQRELFVKETCTDQRLLQHVRSLLAAHPHADQFLETPVGVLFESGHAIADLTGQQLGPYEVGKQIGSGGMGDVYRGRDSRLNRSVAIKVLQPHAADDEASRNRFEREARAVAALNHPHICTLHDIGVAVTPSGDVRYLVMEFLDGETLAAVLARGALPPAVALKYAIEIASALSAAHHAGIVHRDLKPGNVMITASGAKLLDFGLAIAGAAPPSTSVRELSGVTRVSTTLIGTIAYMAPERLRGETADARADVFAFGCVLHEMLTATSLFDADHGPAEDSCDADLAPPNAVDDRGLRQAGVQTIVRKCVAFDPDDRWQTVDDLLPALAQAVDARLPRQRRVLFAVSAIAALLLAIGGWMFASDTPVPTETSEQLAVLPLRAIGDIAGDEHYKVAIADAIITRLAALHRIGLRPTTAVLNYADASPDPSAAAAALAVDYILTGTIQRRPSTYRLTFQLVRAPNGAVTWSRSYEVVRDGLRDLPDNVAEQVSGALRLELGPDERGRLRARYRAQADAYDRYFKGRAALLNYTETGMKEAIDAFEGALTIDPEFALARAGLALASAWWSIRYAYESDALRWGARADTEARAALKSDPSLGEARLAMAGAAGTLYGGFKWPAVIDDAQRALAIDPTLELAHVVLMRAYFHFGLFDRMAAEAEAARRLNPLGNVEVARLEVAASLFSGAYARARDQALALLARSEAPVIRQYLGLAQFYTGDVMSARRTLAAVRRGNLPDVRSQAALASVEAAVGEREAARARALAIGKGPYMDHHVAYSLGAAWAQLGDVPQAVKWLQQAADTGFPSFPSMQRDPLLAGIRHHPEFSTFLEELRQRFERDTARYGAAQ